MKICNMQLRILQNELFVLNEKKIYSQLLNSSSKTITNFFASTIALQTSSSSSTIGNEDIWEVELFLHVKALIQRSNSLFDSLKNVNEHNGVSKPHCRTVKPGCFDVGNLSTIVFLRFKTPKGRQTFFCG